MAKGKKTGGRHSGTRNKNTLILETFAETIAKGGMEKFQQELDKLSGKDYINAYLTVFEFVKPKLARTEHKAAQEQGNNLLKIEIVSPPENSTNLP